MMNRPVPASYHHEEHAAHSNATEHGDGALSCKLLFFCFHLQTYRRCEDMKVLLRKSSERPWLYWWSRRSRRSRHSHGALWRALGRSHGRKWWNPWWHGGFPWRPCWCWRCSSRWWPCTNPWGQWVVSVSRSCVCWSQLGHFFDVLQLIHAEIIRNTCTCSFSKQIKSLDEVI